MNSDYNSGYADGYDKGYLYGRAQGISVGKRETIKRIKDMIERDTITYNKDKTDSMQSNDKLMEVYINGFLSAYMKILLDLCDIQNEVSWNDGLRSN